MSDRLNRKNLKHDRFVEGAEETFVSVRHHARTAAAIAGGVALLIIAGISWVMWQQSREAKAQTALAQAISEFERPLAGEEEQANPGAKTWSSEDERLEQTEPMFRELVEQHRGTDASDVAALYLGQILVRRDRAEEALPLFERFVRAHPDHLLAGTSQLSIYQIRMSTGQKQEVMTEIERELSADEPRVPKDALLAMLAQAHEADGQSARAREAWQRIANEYPDSPYAADAQRRIARS